MRGRCAGAAAAADGWREAIGGLVKATDFPARRRQSASVVRLMVEQWGRRETQDPGPSTVVRAWEETFGAISVRSTSFCHRRA